MGDFSGQKTVPDAALTPSAQSVPDSAFLEAIAFVGESLSPFYRQDPVKGSARASYDALASLDVTQAAQEWPFASLGVAFSSLSMMSRSVRQNARTVLAEEYRRLFVGPARKAAAPWGSVYTDRDQVIFGQTELDLHLWMCVHGVACERSSQEPVDHIGTMLALMAWLARNRPELLDEFLSDHFLTWAPHFLDYLVAATQLDFYAGLATLTKASLEGARAERGLSVVEPRFYR